MSKFTGFSEKSFFKKKTEIWAKSMGCDAMALNFSNELDFTDCSMQLLERLDF